MKRADYIRQNTGKSFVKAMTDEELANFMSAFEKQNGDKLTTKENITIGCKKKWTVKPNIKHIMKLEYLKNMENITYVLERRTETVNERWLFRL